MLIALNFSESALKKSFELEIQEILSYTDENTTW